MKPYIIVRKIKGKKKTDTQQYEIFHIVESKDILEKTIYAKQSVGITSVDALKGEIMEYELQVEYRKRVLDEIANIEKKKALLSNVVEVLDGFKKERALEGKK